MSRKKDKQEYSINHTEQLYNRFLNLALNRFTWSNLPEGLTSRKMEEFLCKHGKVMFYKNSQGVLLALPCYDGGRRNYYNEPIEYEVVGVGYQDKVSIEDGVVIRNNALGTCDDDDILLFAERINEVEQTMDVNLFQQNINSILLCDEKERLTVRNIIQQIKEFKYVIIGKKGLALSSTEVLNNNTPYLIDKLQLQKRELLNELLTFLGINNANTDKKERLIVDEVNANNDFILVNLDHMFDEREKAAKEINEKFGLNIKVEKREVKNGEIYVNTTGDNIE